MRIVLAAAVLVGMSVCMPAVGGHHEGGADVMAITKADYRAKDMARDQYRHPVETLAFFGITPTMSIGEYGPGGGWYTRILAPYVANAGRYVAVHADIERYSPGLSDEDTAKRKDRIVAFPERVTEWTGTDAAKVTSVEIDEAEDLKASLDAFVIFRSLHGLNRKGMLDETLAQAYAMLKPGGMVGVVQHRAKEDASYDYTRGHNGYLKQSEVIAMFESQGFELVKTSEINANSKDSADWNGGVWSLPPTLRHKEQDKDKYLAVGESDRMTLLFKKPA